MSTNCIASPLSQSQKTIWALLGKGLTVSTIAEKLKTTRQYVNQTRLTTQTKLATTLLEVAASQRTPSNQTQPPTSHPTRLPPRTKKESHHHLHHQPRSKSLVLARQPEEVTDTAFLNQTRQYLIDIAKERGIEIEDADKIHPAKLAHTVFCQLIPELKT